MIQGPRDKRSGDYRLHLFVSFFFSSVCMRDSLASLNTYFELRANGIEYILQLRWIEKNVDLELEKGTKLFG